MPVLPPSLQAAVPHSCTPGCSLLDLVVFNPVFSTFVAALKVSCDWLVESCSPLIGPQLAGLITLLTEPGPFTVFAPTNAAFEAVAPVKLQAVLADPVLLR